jgi:WD40 repeat protein
MKGDGQTYVDKLEEKMINNAAKAPDDEQANSSQVALINGSVLIKQGKEENEDMIKLRYNVKGHFDSVREMFYLENMHVLASVAEDCQVHLWNVKNIATESDRLVSSHEQLNLESYCTLRGHRGAIYSVAGIHNVVS